MKKARGQEKRSKSRQKWGREREKKRNIMGNGYKKGEWKKSEMVES